MPRRPGSVSPVQLDTTPVPPVLHARDHPRHHLLALERGGKIQQLRRGAYVPTAHVAELPPFTAQRVRTLGRVAAVAERLRSAVVSHESAAALWGLPLVTANAPVHVIQPSRPSSRRARDVIRHTVQLDADDVTEHRGYQVTSLERTVVDCAMALAIEPGLILADAALHIGADLETCREILARLGSRAGSVRARTVLEYADGGSESSGETRTRLLALRAGFPRPVTQLRVDVGSETFWSDVGWVEQLLVAEYDGAAKYTARGSAAAEVLEEKRREDLIRAEGYGVVRVDRSDFRNSAPLLAQMRRLGKFGDPIPRPELNA